MRKTFQAVYGSWAGTLVAAGRSDDDIRAILESSTTGIDSIDDEPEARRSAHRARENMLANLPIIRRTIAERKKP